MRALANAVDVCLGAGPCPYRRASREEWSLLERVLSEGQAGPPPSDADVALAAQLQVERGAGGAVGRVQQLPWVWLRRGVSPARVGARPGPAQRAERQVERGRSRCGRPCSTAVGERGVSMSEVPEIIVTTQDFERLQRLVACTSSSAAERLDAELARARLVAQTDIPADVVTMNSDVIYEDAASGERRVVRLVYPKDAEAARGWVSVLAPVGSALLGLRQGQAIEWPVPRGTRRLRVVAVPYQPESQGHFGL